jgi:peptidoglycan/xylan/chitin deacetylase (PgdA/CDA1 family)
MNTARNGDWVQVHRIVLTADERAPQVPDDTKRVPLEVWVKGTLQHDAAIGDPVLIITMSGRKETGTLVAVNPGYAHGFGRFVPELHAIEIQLNELRHEGGS